MFGWFLFGLVIGILFGGLTGFFWGVFMAVNREDECVIEEHPNDHSSGCTCGKCGGNHEGN